MWPNRLGRQTSVRRPAALRPHRKAGSFGSRVSNAADRYVFNWQVRSKLYRHLSVQVGNGIAVERSLDNFAASLARRGRVSSAKVVRDVGRRLRDGKSLTQSFARWVPSDELSVIDAAEASGNMPALLGQLVKTKRQQRKVTRAYRNAAVRPVIYTVSMYGVLWAIGKYAVPNLKAGNVSENSSASARALFTLGDLANGATALVIPLVAILIYFLIRRAMPRWTGRVRVFAERFFPFSYYRDLQGFLWFASFIAMLRASVPDVQILQRQLEHASPWLRERLRHIRLSMENGVTLEKALITRPRGWKSGFNFPSPDLIESVESFAGFPDFAETMSNTLAEWSADLEEASVERAAVAAFGLEIAMWILMGLLGYAMYVVQSTTFG